MGSCYSSERPIQIPSNLTKNPKEAAKKLSAKSSLKTVNYTAIKEKLLNNHKTSFKTRKKSILKPSHSLNSTRPTSEYVEVCLNNSYKDTQLDQETDNDTPKLEHIISLYTDFSLIDPHVNKSNQLIEYEEYDNSSLKFFDYLNNDDNLIFGDDDINKYYPFPTFDSHSTALANIDSIQFECKIFNRIPANSSEMPSNSIQNHYQQMSSMSSVGGGGVPDSDSSSIMTYSNSNSPQSSSIPSLKNSVQSTKPATKLNRFGFKPGITSSIPIDSVAVQQSKEVKKSTQVSTSMPVQSSVLVVKKIPTALTSLHIEEPIEQTQNRIKSPTEKTCSQIGRLPLPSHSFSKPLVSNQNLNKIQQVSSSSTTSTSASSNANDYNIDQSSSLSSLSSASSSFSNKNLIDANNNQKKTVQSIAKNTKLTPPKISTKLPSKALSSPGKPALVSLASNSTTSTTSSSSVSPKLPKQYQSNTAKSSLLLNNKRRLFNPYKQTTTTTNTNSSGDALSKNNSGKNESVNTNLNSAKTVDTSSQKDTPTDAIIKSKLFFI